MPKRKEYWSTAVAIEKAAEIGVEVSLPTLIKWCGQYNLGLQLGGKGGKWYITPNKFMDYIKYGKINYEMSASDKDETIIKNQTDSDGVEKTTPL